MAVSVLLSCWESCLVVQKFSFLNLFCISSQEVARFEWMFRKICKYFPQKASLNVQSYNMSYMQFAGAFHLHETSL